MRVSKRFYVLAALVALAGAGTVTAARLGSSERLLIPKARRIAPWYSAGMRVVQLMDLLNRTSILQVETDMRPPRGVSVSRFDLTTGVTQPLPALSATIRRLKGTIDNPSADGRWLIFRPDEGEGISLSALSLDGSTVIRWPEVDVMSVPVGTIGTVWLDDNRTFVVMFTGEAFLYRVDSPGHVKRIPLPKLPDFTVVAGTFTAGRILLGQQLNRPVDDLQLASINLSASPALVTYSKIRLPARATVADIAVSPDGKRLALQLKVSGGNDSWLVRKLKALAGSRPHKRDGIWVCDLDGSGMREIGHVHDDPLYLNVWVPGGKEVAFLHGDHLYLVPVAGH